MVDANTVVVNGTSPAPVAAAPAKKARRPRAQTAPVASEVSTASASAAAAPVAVAPVTAAVVTPVVLAKNIHTIEDLKEYTKVLLGEIDMLRNGVRDMFQASRVLVRNMSDQAARASRASSAPATSNGSTVAASAASDGSRRRRHPRDPNAPKRVHVPVPTPIRAEFANFLMAQDPSHSPAYVDGSLVSRPTAMKVVWQYIKANNLSNQYPDNKSRVRVDNTLRVLLGLSDDFMLTNKTITGRLSNLFHPKVVASAAVAAPVVASA